MKIFVGNFGPDLTNKKLKEIFFKYGEVESAEIVYDKLTGESRKFGFIKMPVAAEAEVAIEDLNGKAFDGYTLLVNRARHSIQGRNEGNRRSGPPKFKE